MSQVNNDLTITYAGVAAGGSGTSYYQVDKYRHERSYGLQSIEFDCLVIGTTEANFASRCTALENAYAKPRQDLTITLGSTTLLSVAESSKNGMNARPSISKVADERDTGRSRVYRCSVEYDMPADLTSQNHLLDMTIDLSYTPSRLKVVGFSGTYTAVSGGNDARAQYEASIAAYVSTELTALGGTYELVSENAADDDNGSRCNFSRAYEEILTNQSSGTLDNASIVQQRMSIAHGTSAPGDSGSGPKRLQAINVSYDASVDRDQTTDLATLWTGTIFPWILAHAQSVTGSGSVAVVGKDVNYDTPANRISASLSLLTSGGSGIVQQRISTRDNLDAGKVIIPVWSGDPLAARVILGAATQMRDVSIETTALAGSEGQAVSVVLDMYEKFVGDGQVEKLATTKRSQTTTAGAQITGRGGGTAPVSAASGSGSTNSGKWVPTSKSSSEVPITLGTTDGQIDIVQLTDLFQFRRVTEAKASSFGSGKDIITGGSPTVSKR